MLRCLVTATLDSRLPKTGIGVPCRGGLLLGRAGFVLAAMLGLLACSESEESTPPDPPPGFSESRWQTDADGRVVLHRGVNISNLQKNSDGYIYPWPEHFGLLDELALTQVRYLVFWEAIEPSPGQYDYDYIQAVREQMEALSQRGISVLVDMHQDVWGAGFGFTGMPRWACDEEYYESFVPSGAGWFTNYFSDEVRACFDVFYSDESLQESFAAAWVAVIQEVRDLPGVDGYEVLNEPFWGNTPAIQYEEEALAPFYERVVPLLAAADPGKPIYVEPGVHTNPMFARPALPELDVGEVTLVLAPHLYPAWTEGAGYPGELDLELEHLDAIVALAVQRSWALSLTETGTPLSQEGGADYLHDIAAATQARGMDLLWWTVDPRNLNGNGLLHEHDEGIPGSWSDEARQGLALPLVHKVPGEPEAISWQRDSEVLEVRARDIGSSRRVLEIRVPDGLWPGELNVTGDVADWTRSSNGRVLEVTVPPSISLWTVTVAPVTR